MDKITPEQRSHTMSLIHSKDTKPEIVVRKYLFSKGLRFRKNDKRFPGHPDIVFPKYRTIVFVHGCFWHGHEDCKNYVFPKSNVEFWRNKIQKNKERDLSIYKRLSELGWSVFIVWECELKPQKREQTLSALYDNITNAETANY